MSFSLRERAPLYALASRLLHSELDAALVETLRAPDALAMMERAAPGSVRWLETADGAESLAGAREEFARLFLVPGGVPAAASFWIDGPHEAVGAQIATLVTRALDALALEIDEREPWSKLPLDHLALVFELVVRALGRGDDAGERIAAHLDRELLGAWVGRFGEALATKTELPPYLALGRILAAAHAAAPDADVVPAPPVP